MSTSSCLLSSILYSARPLSYPLPFISSSLLPSFSSSLPITSLPFLPRSDIPSLPITLRLFFPSKLLPFHSSPPPSNSPFPSSYPPPLLLMRCTADSLTPGDLINHPQVRELLRSELRNVCTNFKSYERPLGWAAVLEPFSQVRTHELKCIQPYEHVCTYNCKCSVFASISFE